MWAALVGWVKPTTSVMTGSTILPCVPVGFTHPTIEKNAPTSRQGRQRLWNGNFLQRVIDCGADVLAVLDEAAQRVLAGGKAGQKAEDEKNPHQNRFPPSFSATWSAAIAPPAPSAAAAQPCTRGSVASAAIVIQIFIVNSPSGSGALTIM